MEALEGTPQADTLSGTGGANILRGLNGADLLIGGAGADTLDGGDGADTASYEERATAVTASLAGSNTDADIYTSISRLTGGSGDDALTGDALANTLDGAGGDDVLAGAGAADVLIGGPGRNLVSYDERTAAVSASLAPSGPRPDGDTYAQIQSLRGGDGDDTLAGDAATNRLEGGAGDDVLVGGAADDDLIGGSGRNTASYQERTTPVVASLAPSGPKPDSDVFVQIHNLRGGAGGDTLTGDATANVVDGGAGADVVTGLAGFDDLRGGAGADTINARDGAADAVDCGANGDTASVDVLDTTTACEALRFPDGDGDGADASRDCNDADRAIHPGAAEIIDNAVDENCDGIAAVTPDGDGDGFNARLDCNDANPRIRPGALEIPGNDVDENCDRAKPDFPLIGASIAISTRSGTRFTRVIEVIVTAIPAGGRIELRCKPPKRARRACPFKRVRRAFPDGRRRIDLARRFKGRRLPVGTVIEVRVLAPGTIGKVSTRRVARSSTKRRLLCLRPGAQRPSRCPNS
jgi:Ca2+-binding RTX toxin-like protein